MRTAIANSLTRLARFISPKAMPSALAGDQWSGTSYVDAYKRNRAPTPNDLMAELKNTAWACISINSAVCASNPPQLYAITNDNHASPKCLTKALHPYQEARLRRKKNLPVAYQKATRIEEVIDHPLLTLLARVNPVHNSFDLWELTTLYQEVHGSAYWQLDYGPLGIPQAIWILPSQNVTPKRNPGSPNIVDYYLYRSGRSEQRFSPNEIIHFRYPDPRDPYNSGLAPLRACFEQVALTSDYAAMKKAIYENKALPNAIISPADVLGEEERDRLERQWNDKFRRGGAGRALIAESNLTVETLQQSMGDLAQLAEMQATKEDICNAFHTPIAYMTTNTNLANLAAAKMQHMQNCIGPRLERRDQKLNEQLIPLYDTSGRLFLSSEDPMPIDASSMIAQQQLDMETGIITINEQRSERGLPPVPWGNLPWLPTHLAPTDVPRTMPGANAPLPSVNYPPLQPGTDPLVDA